MLTVRMLAEIGGLSGGAERDLSIGMFICRVQQQYPKRLITLRVATGKHISRPTTSGTTALLCIYVWRVNKFYRRAKLDTRRGDQSKRVLGNSSADAPSACTLQPAREAD